jgi:hypothetical protein
MKKSNNSFLLLVVLPLIILFGGSCSKSDPHGLSRLEGQWKANVDGIERIESWADLQTEPYSISGTGNELQNGVEKPVEEMTIVESEGLLTYIVKAIGQNNENPVSFLLVSGDDDKTLRFENPKHDFPQYIQYEFLEKDHIIAKIGALGKENSPEEYVFDFLRVRD